MHFQQPTFSGIDSSYSLPNNTALLTLQVWYGVTWEDCLLPFHIQKLHSIEDETLRFSLTFYLIFSLICIYCFYEYFAGFWKRKSTPKTSSPLWGCNYFTDLQIAAIFGSILVIKFPLHRLSYFWIYECWVLLHVKVGEDKDYSVTANVELKRLFPNKKVRGITNYIPSNFLMHVYLDSF